MTTPTAQAPRPTVMIWHPGATISTADVAAGLGYGLEAHNINVLWYRTDHYIEAAGAYLQAAYALKVQDTKRWWMAPASRLATWLGTSRAAAARHAGDELAAWVRGRQGKRPPEPTQADTLHWANKDILYRALRARREQGLSWVLCVSGMYQHPDFVVLLRDAGLKVAFLATESPYDAQQELRMAGWVDAVFTCERAMVAEFARVNPNSFYLPHGWHPVVHQLAAMGPETDVLPYHDVVFVGTFFDERIEFLASIDWTGIDLGLYGNTDDIDLSTSAGQKLAPYIRGGYLPNQVTAALYRKARVGLNLHRRSKGYQSGEYIGAGEAESLNPRCYELAAVGCYFLTDARAEAADVFGDTVDTFATPAECEALIRQAIANPRRAVAQAMAAAKRVQSHTWTERAGRVLRALARVELQETGEPAA